MSNDKTDPKGGESYYNPDGYQPGPSEEEFREIRNEILDAIISRIDDIDEDHLETIKSIHSLIEFTILTDEL
jgi:hypothetical protein